MLRQIHFLMYSPELGFRHQDIGLVFTANHEELKEKLRQSSLVTETFDDVGIILPLDLMHGIDFSPTKEWSEDRSYILANVVHLDSAIARFYNFQLVAGRLPIAKNLYHLRKTEREVLYATLKDGKVENVYGDVEYYPHEVCISEGFCRAMKITPDSAIGLKLYCYHEHVVTGVLKDAYIYGPVVEPLPMVYMHWDDDKLQGGFSDATVFGTQPGRIAELCDSIRVWSKDECTVHNIEHEYEEYVASELMLIKILLAVGGASLFVCIIGTFSLVSLSLQRRKKEIAIRKVHGATLKNIISLFMRSHVISLCLSALIAYPIAYIIMRRWLEGYQKQVGIDWWIIPVTFAVIAFIVIATISLKIWNEARKSTVEGLQ